MSAKAKRRAPRQPRYQGAGFLREISRVTDAEQRRIDAEKRAADEIPSVPDDDTPQRR